MEVVNIKIQNLVEAPWNTNVVKPEIMDKIERSIKRFGIVENEIVRPIADGKYEVISGNHRLRIYKKLAFESAPCVVKNLSDADAYLLAQIINNTRGENDISKESQLYKELQAMADFDIKTLVEYLPKTEAEIEDLLKLQNLKTEDVFGKLRSDKEKQFHQINFVLAEPQLEIVKQALEKAKEQAEFKEGINKNINGNCLELICADFLAGVSNG